MKKTLLLGCGSVGQKHLQRMSEVSDVFVVDPRADQISSKLAPRNHVAFFSNIDEIDKNEFPGMEYAVVATLGPDHFDHTVQLADLGLRKIIVEKPLVNSLKYMKVLLSDTFAANIWVNYTLRFQGIAGRLMELAEEFDLGEVLSLTVTGGAKCLATNGLHYIDLACSLFGKPIDSNGYANSAPINPRGENLLFLEGVFVSNFQNNKSVVISFQNRSHSPAQLHTVFEKGEISWSDPVLASITTREMHLDTSPSTRSKALRERFEVSLVPLTSDPIANLHDLVESGDGFARHDWALETFLNFMMSQQVRNSHSSDLALAIS